MHERRIGDTKAGTPRVALLGSTLHIGNLEVPLDAAAEYMRGIPEEKWEAAFVHAVQVGMSEIVARRRRFHTGANAAARAPMAPQAEPIAPPAKVITTPTPVIAPRAEVIAPRPEPIAARAEVVAPRMDAVALPTEVVKHVEEKEVVQPTVTLPPEPRMEVVEAPSSAARSTAAQPPPEPEGWLRSLDDELESLDSVHPLDASRSGR